MTFRRKNLVANDNSPGLRTGHVTHRIADAFVEDGFPEAWKKRVPIPPETKKKLQNIVHGKVLREISVGGKTHGLLSVDGEVFRKTFSICRPLLYRGEYTADPAETDYSKALCVLTDDGLSGFSITEDKWLVSLFSMHGGGFVTQVPDIMEKAQKLVCVASGDIRKNNLVGVYSKLGFRICAVTRDDTETFRRFYGSRFINEFTALHGRPYHVFMCRGAAPEKIQEFSEYFEAEHCINAQVFL